MKFIRSQENQRSADISRFHAHPMRVSKDTSEFGSDFQIHQLSFIIFLGAKTSRKLNMSKYARQMGRLSAQIFGEQVRNVPIKSKKVHLYHLCIWD